LEDCHWHEEEVIAQIKIVLAGLPALAADLVERAVGRQTDMAVIGRLESPSQLLELAKMTMPDVVIVGFVTPELPPQCLDLMVEHCALTVLGVEQQHGRGHLYRMRPEHSELGEVTANDLVGQIRTAVHQSPAH
jgi:chemotaxis response regulator CheB